METLTRILFIASLGCLVVLTYQLDQANQRAAAIETKTAQAREQALQAAYALERQHAKKLEEIEYDTQAKLDTLRNDAARARATANGLRSQLTRFTADGRAQDSAAACKCEAATARTDVLSELLVELDGMAGAYAQTADDARVRGLACEWAYGAVKTDGMDEKQ